MATVSDPRILVPFNKPALLGTELGRVQDVIERTGLLAGNGPFGQASEILLKKQLGNPAAVLLVTSATHALELMALLLDLGPGDEVIVPSYTFVSTANAFALRGADVVFGECDTTGNLDLLRLDKLLTPRTKAICAVHYAGNSADMHALASYCDARGLVLLEDAAQAMAGVCRGQPLGTFGALACFSFHETKNVSCGEGGALIVNRPDLLARAEILREKGTNRRAFQQGLVDKYSWVDVGSSYVLSELNAAFLSAQLEELGRIQAKRCLLHSRYADALLHKLPEGVCVLPTPVWNVNNGHLFACVLASYEDRTRFIAHMRERGVVAPFHYVALHSTAYAQEHYGHCQRESNFVQTQRLAECLVRLPLFYNMTEAQQTAVIEATLSFFR